MRHHEFSPCPGLEPYVRLIWVLELDRPADFGPPERIAPDGLLEVVFHYGTPFACRHAGGGFVSQPRSVAISQTRRFVEIRPEGPIGLISVRFQPWGAYHFLGLPISELADAQVATGHLWGREANDLEERLAEAASMRERVALVERFLLSQLHRHRKVDVEPLVRTIWSRRGQVTVRELCARLGVGERRLQRTFAAALGTTPKGFVRLSRFLSACGLLRSGRESTLTDVGLASGYYDQSHFIADFKVFSGMTPSQFVEASGMSFLDVEV
jgi:AraC-like DNA-binding protein